MRGFVEILGARTPAPGGGSAAALAASMGAALGAMVGWMTYGKRKFEEKDAVMRRLIPPLHEAMEALIPLVDRDTRAFDAYLAAVGMPKETDTEKASRHAAMQAALKEAVQVPLEVMRTADRCWEPMLEMAAHGNPASRSDLEVGGKLLEAGIWGASRNVAVNLPQIEDEAFRKATLDEAESLAARAAAQRDRVLGAVAKRALSLAGSAGGLGNLVRPGCADSRPDPGVRRMTRSEFAVEKMDCAAEERLVRLALEDRPGVLRLAFDLSARRLTVWHQGDPAAIQATLDGLRLGARLERSGEETGAAGSVPSDSAEGRTLRVLLAINSAMFVVEVVAGWLAESAGLLADSLDMFADAAVYSLALYAVGRAPALKLRAAHASGGLQLLLALGAFAEVVRRALAGSVPEPPAMIGVGLLALAANVSCLLLVARHRHAGAHMKASYIFSANDVLANLGVMAAGGLVALTGSRLPDLAIGSLIAAVVLAGAVRILRLR